MSLGIQERHYAERHYAEGNVYDYKHVLDESCHMLQGFGTENWSLCWRR